MPAKLKLSLWNINWSRATSTRGKVMRDRLSREGPEIVCVTEGHTDFLEGEGHQIASHEDYGYSIKPGRRKVLLWSKQPWRGVDQLGDPSLPTGRFVRGVTDTPIGEVCVIGVCIPWAHAHVSTGQKDRRPWEDHQRYLEGLCRLLLEPLPHPTLVVGDFNQAIPRTTAPKKLFQALTECLDGLIVATAGDIAGAPRPTIDHLAHNLKSNEAQVSVLSNDKPEGGKLSDHFGLTIEIAVTSPPVRRMPGRAGSR